MEEIGTGALTTEKQEEEIEAGPLQGGVFR